MTTRDMRLIFFILAVALVLCLVLPPVLASSRDDDDRGDIDIDIGDVNVPVDVLVNAGDLSLDQNLQFDSKAYALAPPGLGGVAIARCLGSEAWTLLIGGKQKLVLNQVCMADFYLKVGRYDLAAQALCNQPEILEEYPSEVACEIDHDFTPAIVEGASGYDHDIHSRSDEFDLAYAVQEEEIEYLQEEQATLVGRVDYLTELLEQAPTAATPIYIQQAPEPRYTEEDAAYILGLYSKGGDENEQ